MRLRRLDLTRYGMFTAYRVDFGERRQGEPNLHIVYGPNEAGKSTALAAFLDCKSAPNCDLLILFVINDLRRRSASGPCAE